MKDFVLILMTGVAATLAIAARGAEIPSDDDIITQVLYLTGATDPSELDASEYERYENLHQHPIRINRASRQLLQEILSPWQAASIEDYRSRCGDILSWTELAAVDAFDEATVASLKPFISLDTGPVQGRTQDELLSRASYRADGRYETATKVKDPVRTTAWALKYRHIEEGRWRLALTAKNSYSDDGLKPSEYSGSAAIYGRRKHFRQLVVGDYYARFGSGLGLWNGFSLSGISSLQAFRRRGGGVSPAWTVSPSSAFRGAAATWEFGRWSVTPLASVSKPGTDNQEILGAVNLSRLGRISTQSFTAVKDTREGGGYSRLALGDARSLGMLRIGQREIGALDISAETAMDLSSNSAAAVATAILTPSYGHRVAFLLRWYDSDFSDAGTSAPRAASHSADEAGGALGLFMPRWQSTLDISRKLSTNVLRVKSLTTASITLAQDLVLRPRLNLGWRGAEDRPLRCDLRVDLDKEMNDWQLRIRANAVKCRNISQLYYAEAGRKTEKLSCYARASLFCVDRWDDRIYSYERDVPGYFNVPAYYGRGFSASISGALTLRPGTPVSGRRYCRYRISWRLSGIHYTKGPVNGSGDSEKRKDKPSRLEARIQYIVDL